MARGNTDPNTIERERQVIEMRRAGATFDDIAHALGFAHPSGAHAAFQRAMKRTLTNAGTEELREQEADRLDRLQRAYWVQALSGDVPAANVVLKVMDRRARLMGLDAPIRQEIKVEQVDPAGIDAEVARLVELLKATP